MAFKIEFEQHISNLDSAIAELYGVINAYIRRKTDGQMYGICDFQVKNNQEVFFYLSSSKGIYLGKSAQNLEYQIAEIVRREFCN